MPITTKQPTTTPEEDLTATKAQVRAAMILGTKGSRIADRVDEQLWEYQRALRRVHARRLAAKIRATADTLTDANTAVAYRVVADLAEETEL